MVRVWNTWYLIHCRRQRLRYCPCIDWDWCLHVCNIMCHIGSVEVKENYFRLWFAVGVPVIRQFVFQCNQCFYCSCVVVIKFTIIGRCCLSRRRWSTPFRDNYSQLCYFQLAFIITVASAHSVVLFDEGQGQEPATCFHIWCAKCRLVWNLSLSAIRIMSICSKCQIVFSRDNAARVVWEAALPISSPVELNDLHFFFIW